jgi:hypothetical protein
VRKKAVWGLVLAALALAVMVGGAAAAQLSDRINFREAWPVAPLGFILAIAAVSLSRRARSEKRRRVVPERGSALVLVARGLAAIALIVATTATLALAVFAVLSLVL